RGNPPGPYNRNPGPPRPPVISPPGAKKRTAGAGPHPASEVWGGDPLEVRGGPPTLAPARAPRAQPSGLAAQPSAAEERGGSGRAWVLAVGVLATASSWVRVRPPASSMSPDISAMPCALSLIGPNVSIATITPTVVSSPVPASATANSDRVIEPPPSRNAP